MPVRTVVVRFQHVWETLTQALFHSAPKPSPSQPDLMVYRGLYDQTHDAVFVIDLEGHYLYANQRATDLLGYGIHELRRLSLREISAELPESQIMLKRLLAGEFIPPYERSFRKKDGSLLVGEITAELVSDPQGKPHHIQSVVRDIQQRKQAEDMLRRQNEYLTVLHRVTLDLINRRNRDDLLQSIINYMSQILNVPYVEALLKEDGEMVTRACTPNIQYLVGDRGRYSETSLVWRAHDTLKFVTVDDYSKYPFRNPVYGDLTMTAVACFPIVIGQECVGVLDATRSEFDHPFTAQELQQGELFAQMVALLLNNVTLHESAALEIERRKQTEQDLQASEQRQRALLSAMPDLMFRFSRDGRYLDYHAPDPQVLIAPPEALMGRHISEVLSSEVSALHMAHLRQVLDTGRESQYEYALMLQGQMTYYESRMVVSGPDEVLTINRNITDRKQMEQRDSAFLRDMKALQEIFFALSRINDLQELYIQMVRLTQERLNIDRVALFIIDQEAGELRGTYGVDPGGHLRDEGYYREVITDTHWTLPILNSAKHAMFWADIPIYDNGVQIGSGWKTATALWDGHDAVGYLISDNFLTHQAPRSYQDELSSLLGNTYGHLIRLKQTQITLRRSEERHRALLSAIPDLMFRFDRDGIFLDYYSADLQNLVVPPEQFLGRRIADVMPADIAALQAYHLERVLKTGHEAIYEYTLPRDGEAAYFESRMVVSGQDEVTTIIRDITERKKLEEQTYALVMETARADVLSQFVQNASHELRTPLSTINTALYLMGKTDDPVKRAQYTERAAEHIRQLSRLLDMVLLMTRLDSNLLMDKRRLDLNDWVHRVVNAAQDQVARKGLAVTFAPEPALPTVLGDPVWLQEAFGSLLTNAIRFTPENGTIQVRTYSEDDCVVVEFRDSGIGIAADALPHIFERFWRVDEAHTTPGFGLGLSIALKIIELHEGRIDVDSVLGAGSTFSVRLPALGS